MSANVFKKGAVWHYRFQVGGDRVQRTTRLRSRACAEAFAQEQFDAAVLRANGGEPVPTLAAMAESWMDVHQPIVSDSHYRSVETFQRLHLYGLGPKQISDITTEDVELARNMHLKDHSAATANHWLRILKLLTMWAVRRKILKQSPWKVQMMKVQKRPRSILAVDIALMWFGAIDKASRREPAIGTAVRLMFGLGLRESESISARWEWIDWQRKTYTPGITKGREAEPVPLADWLIDHLAPMRKSDGLIAAKKDGDQLPNGFARAPMRIANTACSIKGITPHRLRGTFATLLSEAGVSIQNIQAVMRHKSPLTTMAYLEKNREKAAIAQDEIAKKIGFSRRESGAPHRGDPTDI